MQAVVATSYFHIQSKSTVNNFPGFTPAHNNGGLFFFHACLSSVLFDSLNRDRTETEEL